MQFFQSGGVRSGEDEKKKKKKKKKERLDQKREIKKKKTAVFSFLEKKEMRFGPGCVVLVA